VTEIIIKPPFDQLWQGKDPFVAVETIEGEIYRQLEGRKTLRFEIDGKGYFLKLHRGIGWKEVFKNIIQLRMPVTGAVNEKEAIEELEQLGIQTLSLVVFGRKGIDPAREFSFIITRELSNTLSLEEVCADWVNKPPPFWLKLALLRRVGEVSRKLHSNGINHRDYYLCHFLLKDVENVSRENIDLFLIDLHRAHVRGKTPMRWRVKDIGGLYHSAMDANLTRNDVFRFMKIYSGKKLGETMRQDGAFWRKVEKKALSLYYKEFKTNPPDLARGRTTLVR